MEKEREKAKLNIELDRELLKRFRVVCAEKDIKMSKAIRSFIKAFSGVSK